jgi:hypothetical protein
MIRQSQSLSRHPSRTRHRPIIAAGIVLVAGAVLVGGLVAWGLHGPEAPIVVSPQTTLLTEPLAADGLPDYARYALALAGRGIPPADNAAVPLLEAFWPMDLDDADLAAVCQDLGIERPDDPLVGFEGDNFHYDDAVRAGIDSTLEALGPSPPPAEGDQGSPRPNPTTAVIDAASGHPWRSADLPSLTAWLTRNGAGLDLVVEAARRPRLSLPVPALLAGKRGRLLFDTPPPLQAIRSGGRGLTLRAMASLGDGRFAEAWSDLLAVHRLARLAAEADAGSLVGHLMATAVTATTWQATLHLLDAAELPGDLLATVRRDLDALPPWPEPRRSIVTERLGMLDFMIHVSRLSREERAEVLSVLECKDPAIERTFTMSLDWNTLLGEITADYARLDTALGPATWADRQRALRQLEREVAEAVAAPAGSVRQTLHAAALLASRRERSRRIPRVFGSNWVPAVRATDAASTRGQAVFELTRTAAALAAFRRDEAEAKYPERLETLVPRFIDRIPLDPFTGGPFHYERRGDGYLLYSVGQDCRDDGGTDMTQPLIRGEWAADESFIGKAEGTDLVVRLPLPANPTLEKIRAARAAEK